MSEVAGGQSVAVRSWGPEGLFHLEPHERVFAFETVANTSYIVSTHVQLTAPRGRTQQSAVALARSRRSGEEHGRACLMAAAKQ